MAFTWNRFVNQFSIWLVICFISAAPGFICGLIYYKGEDPITSALGMGVVVIGFAVAYALACCSDTYYGIRMRPDLYRAFQIGFVIRLVYSVVLFIPVFLSSIMNSDDLFIVAFLMGEGLIGMISIGIADGVMTFFPFIGTWPLFASAVLTTIIHAVLLNVVVLFLVWVIYLFRRGHRLGKTMLSGQNADA